MNRPYPSSLAPPPYCFTNTCQFQKNPSFFCYLLSLNLMPPFRLFSRYSTLPSPPPTHFLQGYIPIPVRLYYLPHIVPPDQADAPYLESISIFLCTFSLPLPAWRVTLKRCSSFPPPQRMFVLPPRFVTADRKEQLSQLSFFWFPPPFFPPLSFPFGFFHLHPTGSADSFPFAFNVLFFPHEGMLEVPCPPSCSTRFLSDLFFPFLQIQFFSRTISPSVNLPSYTW